MCKKYFSWTFAYEKVLWEMGFLTKDQKHLYVEKSERNLTRFQHSPNDFFRRFLTLEETWIHNCTPKGSIVSYLSGWNGAKGTNDVTFSRKSFIQYLWDFRDIILSWERENSYKRVIWCIIGLFEHGKKRRIWWRNGWSCFTKSRNTFIRSW